MYINIIYKIMVIYETQRFVGGKYRENLILNTYTIAYDNNNYRIGKL